MTKENPELLSNLIHILKLDYLPPKPSYKDVKKGKITGIEFQKLMDERNEIKKERKHYLRQFQVGSYRDYEGDGYFNKPLYLYEGKYYA